jgi:hypothetical protein
VLLFCHAQRQAELDLRDDRVGEIGQKLDFATRPFAWLVVQNAERADGLVRYDERNSQVRDDVQVADRKVVSEERMIAGVVDHDRRSLPRRILAE